MSLVKDLMAFPQNQLSAVSPFAITSSLWIEITYPFKDKFPAKNKMK